MSEASDTFKSDKHMKENAAKKIDRPAQMKANIEEAKAIAVRTAEEMNKDGKLTELQVEKLRLFFQEQGRTVEIRSHQFASLCLRKMSDTGRRAFMDTYGFSKPQLRFLADALREDVSLPRFRIRFYQSGLFVLRRVLVPVSIVLDN